MATHLHMIEVNQCRGKTVHGLSVTAVSKKSKGKIQQVQSQRKVHLLNPVLNLNLEATHLLERQKREARVHQAEILQQSKM
jgi:hypothetical protein